MKISFFKTPKHRVFNYKPLYYNADKEELLERVKKIEEGLTPDSTTGAKTEYKFNRERIKFRDDYAEQKRKAKTIPYKRLVTYLAILLFIAIIYLFATNITYLLDPNSYKKEQTQEQDTWENPDWSEDTQIIIVDDIPETTEQ